MHFVHHHYLIRLFSHAVYFFMVDNLITDYHALQHFGVFLQARGAIRIEYGGVRVLNLPALRGVASAQDVLLR